MRKLLLTLAVLCGTVSGWAQTEKVTTINPEKWYQLKCTASDGVHGNGANVWLSDNGTAFAGKSATATFFTFESAEGGKYYIKSNVSGKYVGASGTTVVQEETPVTAWTVGTINEEGYVYISSSTNNYLNNAGGTNNIQVKNHPSGVSSGNPCSLWYLTEYEPTPSSPAAESLLRISEGLLDTQENGQYKWTSPTLAAPAEGEFNKIRVTFLKNSNNSKPAGFHYVAIAEFYLYDKAGNLVQLKEGNFSSNATHIGEGKMSEICDGATTKQEGEGDYDWYWHSQWSGTPNPYGYHYLEIDITDIEADLSEYKIGWVTRQHDGSPTDVIISAGATTNDATKNANSCLLPEVSTEIVKLYTIKSVRSKNFLAYDEAQAKPQQINSAGENAYWYFTQGADGKVVMHNLASGKVLGTNFEMSSEGEWYVSPAVYRPGVVFSKTSDITQNNCIDDQSGSIGSWSHNSGDNEGTTWLVEEVTNAPEVPVLSLHNMQISSVGEAVTEIALDKWYILNNAGRGNYVSQEGNNWKMHATSNIVEGNLAEEKAGYLFKITKNGEYYNVMSGNGKYFQLGQNTASTSASPVNFEIGLISGNNFYLFDKDHGYAADGQETGYNFVGWATSAPTEAGGNDSYRLLPVELFDLGELAVLKNNLSQAIANAQNLYNSVIIGNGVGQYKAPADIEERFATIKAFCESIGAGTTPDMIEEKMSELQALVASVKLNMPDAGKFYRIHNDNKYITSGVTGDRIALSETNNDAASVYYYDGTHLLAYGTGLYMGLNKDDWTFEAVGSTDISAIEIIAAANGVVAKYNIKSGGRWLHRTDSYVDRCSNNTCGDAHNWTIEDVTTLPVAISAADYATFYCPVAVTLPKEGLKAYYVSSVQDGSAKMTLLGGVIPANTGVILEGNEGAYDLAIGGQTESVTSMLSGTVASEYISTPSYVLSAQGTPAVVGFYQAKLNFTVAGNGTGTKVTEDGTHFLNNGFRAYLPAGENNARSLVFDFGTETGIDQLEGENGNVKTEVYDLSGRRVQSAQKGIFIVNGKKVIR
jgi:hypothetical protein